jgi:predicted NUDIX family NTP pyrophosphohydrolase
VPIRSAGVLLWRRRADGEIEVLIAHMGGPYWTGKDDAAWSVPKGEYGDDEEPLDAAVREWNEELGVPLPVPVASLQPLGEVRQRSGKRLVVWAAEGDLDPSSVEPGTFTMPWPPRSGKLAEFPEIDRVEWCALDVAGRRLIVGQREFLTRLHEAVA